MLETGYDNIISNRVPNPYSQIIYYILESISEEQRAIYPDLNKFFTSYGSETTVQPLKP